MIPRTLREFAYRLLGLADRLDGEKSLYMSGVIVHGRIERTSDAAAVITDSEFRSDEPTIRITNSTLGYDPASIAAKINRTIRDFGIASL